MMAVLLVIAGGLWWWLSRSVGDNVPPSMPVVPVEKHHVVPKGQKVNSLTRENHTVNSTAPEKEEQKTEVVPVVSPKKKPQSNAHLLVKDPNARVIPQRESLPRRFKYHSEEFIASLLEMEPGTPVIGEFKFSKRFLEDLKKSFGEKIEILDSDDERTRELKEAVSATKDDLRKRMEAGEDVCQILKESRKQLQELAAYKMDLMAELRNIRKSGEWTAEEYSKFVAAANKMLEDRGAAPIKLPRVIVRQLRKQQEKGDSK